MLRLSVLDQSPVSYGKTPREAINDTVQLAKAADRLGYHRYWVAEHHNINGLAGSAPEILIAHLASQTERLRIGSGGVLLAHYSPFKVAESFRMLEALYPGRIDLGIGRAPGGDYQTTKALQAGGQAGLEQFPEKLEELLGFLHESFASSHPYASIRTMPSGPTTPHIWLLGSSNFSAAMAARLGTAFSFAHFINGFDGPKVVRHYHDTFQPSPYLERPEANAAIFVLCAETDAKVKELVATMDLRLLRIELGANTTVPSVEEALSYKFADWERERVEVNRKRMIYGTPDQVKAKLEKLAEAYGVNDFVVVTITNDFADRLRSYELLAEAFGLSK